MNAPEKPRRKRPSLLTPELRARWIKAFGAEVRRRRKARGWSLDALARRSGISAGFIRSIELGQQEASLSRILALCAGLECEPFELFGNTLSPPALEVALSFDRIQDERARKAIRNVLRAVDRSRAAAKPTK